MAIYSLPHNISIHWLVLKGVQPASADIGMRKSEFRLLADTQGLFICRRSIKFSCSRHRFKFCFNSSIISPHVNPSKELAVFGSALGMIRLITYARKHVRPLPIYTGPFIVLLLKPVPSAWLLSVRSLNMAAPPTTH